MEVEVEEEVGLVLVEQVGRRKVGALLDEMRS